MLVIEPTRHSQDLGKWILIVNDADYSHTKDKLEKLFECISKKKNVLQTMPLSLKRFQAYPEIDGGISTNAITREKAEAFSLALNTQQVPKEVSI